MNYGILKDLILFFKIPMGTRKNVFEIYRQFVHTPSETFCNPGLAVTLHASKFNLLAPELFFFNFSTPCI